MAVILSASGVSKAYGTPEKPLPIIDGLSLSANAGEFLSVVGPSGCGKTTLLMLLAGLLARDAGEVAFNGRPVVAPPAGLAVVFQDYSRSLLPWRRNLENVLLGMYRLDKLGTAEKREKATALMAAVGLSGFEQHYPWQLSGGMQQRVAIARGLASECELLLLDEPLAAVDAQTRADLQDLLLRLAREFRQTCLLVTHDVEEAVYMADRVVILSQRPTRVVEEIAVGLERPRDQLSTREDRRFLEARHHVLDLIRKMRKPAGREAGA
jgi:NitT/TauT family transport system ATP-binding protein